MRTPCSIPGLSRPKLHFEAMVWLNPGMLAHTCVRFKQRCSHSARIQEVLRSSGSKGIDSTVKRIIYSNHQLSIRNHRMQRRIVNIQRQIDPSATTARLVAGEDQFGGA